MVPCQRGYSTTSVSVPVVRVEPPEVQVMVMV